MKLEVKICEKFKIQQITSSEKKFRKTGDPAIRKSRFTRFQILNRVKIFSNWFCRVCRYRDWNSWCNSSFPTHVVYPTILNGYTNLQGADLGLLAPTASIPAEYPSVSETTQYPPIRQSPLFVATSLSFPRKTFLSPKDWLKDNINFKDFSSTNGSWIFPGCIILRASFFSPRDSWQFLDRRDARSETLRGVEE